MSVSSPNLSAERGLAGQTPSAIKSVPKPANKPNGKQLPVLPAQSTYHRYRRIIQFACFLVFVALPFFNVMRFDIPRQRFFFAGYELWINEFGILFFSMLFMLYVVTAASMLYGRIYCGYFCPQMIFSEASLALEERLKKFINKRFIKLPAKKRQLMSGALFYAVLVVAAIFLAFVFISYFVEPRDLLGRLFSLDIRTAGGIAGAATTLIIFLDFAFVRQTFCKTICPYGYLQGMLGDKETLIVQYRDGKDKEKVCIECKKCVRVCHMGIDIRNSPFQIECIHCGECIDACEDVLGRLGKPGLIHYAWGEKGELLSDKKTPLLRRLGLRDAKRVIVALLLVFYASGLFVVLSMRDNVMVKIAPVRTELYRLGDDGRIYNKFRMTVANRQGKDASLTLSLEHLPGAQIELEQPLKLQPAEERQLQFEVSVPPQALPQGINHFEIVSRVEPGGDTTNTPMTFITPTERKPR
ncbi:MAG TPA: FixG Ig-like domain-containing protein [Blastocatellia bacterium]|nr:FixG Ig-like domain-containing protein [Blastocatellia bacterium]